MKTLLLVAFLGALCVAQAAIIVRFNVADNAKTHRTPYRSGGSVQQTQALVVRGYDPIKIDATQDAFPADAEFILFDDLSGLSPIGNGKKPSEWKVTANVAQDRKSLTFSWDQGTIGRFLFGIRSKGKLVYLSKSRIYILFNPWNSKDATAPTGADADKSNQFYVDLNEYVLNEFGAVWRGSATSNSPMAWNYGHLDLGVLDIVMGLLAPLAPSQRNAVLVSRFLTVAGQAVLEGRWPSDPNDYPGGNPPGYWTSSVQILYQYNATGTVKYGQCWVFSSLYTALGRTLGLPTLSITNFDSAHEQQPFKQQCHMRYTGPQASFNRRLSTCSIWNFHVWNHVYIKRTDVPGSSGWQAVDATPQETSSDGPKEAPFNEENYFTGPASLALMRRGAYTTKYDTAFVGGESNAVVYRYHCSGNSVNSCTQSEVVTNQVGEKMYAKMPDSLTTSNVRQGNQGYSRIAFLNWARQYSNVSAFFIELENGPKGQTQQQQQQQASLQSGQSEQSLGSAHEANVTEKGSVSFTVAVPSQLTLGNRFRVALKKKDGANLSGKWMLTLVVRSVDYMTGAAIGPDHLVVHQVVNDMATNRQGLVRRFGNDLWSNSTFLAALAKSSYLSFVFSAVPASSNHKLFLTVETVNVLRPTLPIICGTSPNPTTHKNTYNQGDIMHCVVKFFNPLKIAITGVKVQMTVSGLVAKEELKQVENQKQHKGLTQESVIASASDVDSSGQSVAGFRTIRVGGFQFALNATAGKQQISATFLSQQLRDVFGSNTITIKANPNFAKQQSVQSKMESQAAKSDADADLGQTDAQVLQNKASATLQKAAKALELAFQSKKASVGQFAKQVAKKITLVQHSKDTQKSK